MALTLPKFQQDGTGAVNRGFNPLIVVVNNINQLRK